MAIESVITDLVIEEELFRSNEKRLSENIQYAQKLQDALFRYQYKDLNQNDLFVLDLPRDRVGGDFLLMDEIQGKKVYFCGDCTGHGASGAILTALAFSTIKDLLSKYRTLSPSMIISKAQEKLTEMLEHEGKATVHDNLEGTLVFVNEAKKEITYYSTSQELYLVGPGKQERIRPKKTEQKRKKEDVKLKYENGTWLYLGTDGWKDQFGGARDKKYGSLRILELLSDIYTFQASEQLEAITSNLTAWMKESEEQTDDILFLGILL